MMKSDPKSWMRWQGEFVQIEEGEFNGLKLKFNNWEYILERCQAVKFFVPWVAALGRAGSGNATLHAMSEFWIYSS